MTWHKCTSREQVWREPRFDFSDIVIACRCQTCGYAADLSFKSYGIYIGQQMSSFSNLAIFTHSIGACQRPSWLTDRLLRPFDEYFPLNIGICSVTLNMLKSSGCQTFSPDWPRILRFWKAFCLQGHVTVWSSSFQCKCDQVCSERCRPYATCGQESFSPRRTANTGHYSDVHRCHSWLYNLPTRDDACLSALIAPCASTANQTHVIFLREGLLVGNITMTLFANAVACNLSLYSIDVTWSRDSELPCHVSAVDEGSLAGSTRVRGPTTGDSFSLWYLVLQTDWIFVHNDS